MLPDEMVALHCQSTESDGAGLDPKGSELQELLKIDGEIGVCHDCGMRSRHLTNGAQIVVWDCEGAVEVVEVVRNGTDRGGNNWSDEHRGGDEYRML